MEAAGASGLNDDPVHLLASLCESDPPEVGGQHLSEPEARDSYRALINIEALVESGLSDSVLCLECDEPHLAAVEHVGNGRYRSYCVATGYFDVLASELKKFAVSEDGIAATIAQLLGLNPSRCRRSDVTIHIGKVRFGIYSCHLFFARLLSDRSRFSIARREIEAALGNAPGVLATSTPSELVGGDLSPRCRILHLASVLSLENGRAVFDDDPVVSALRGAEAVAGDAIGCSFSPDFRWGRVGEREYRFTKKQAAVVEYLYDAWKASAPGRVHQERIQAAVGTSQRIGQLFGGHPAYGALIRNDGAGFYWLDL